MSKKKAAALQTTRKRPIDTLDVVIFIVLTLFALIIIYPFYTAIITSVMSSKEYMNTTFITFPKEICWDNYIFMFSSSVIWTGYQSTLMITILGVIYALSISVMMGYGFSRPEFPGKKLIFILMLFTMFFGGGMVPMYLQLKNMHLLNTRAAIILMMGVSPFNIIIIKSSFESIPESLVEAAKIDGANELTIFIKVMLPLQSAILATFALFIAVGYWNEWFWSTMVINETSKLPLQVVLKSIVTSVKANQDTAARMEAMGVSYTDGIKMAAIVVTMLPIMLVYPFLQKYFVKGMLVGAIKM